MSAQCKALVSDHTGFHSFRCENRAKYGEYCGTHAPEKKAERKAKRGPTQIQQEWAARNAERTRAATDLLLWFEELTGCCAVGLALSAVIVGRQKPTLSSSPSDARS